MPLSSCRAGELRCIKPRLPDPAPERGDGRTDCDSPYAAQVVATAHRAKLSGVAFSGGGIRSATYNLGALQALAKLGLLDKIDYLSTVSGGGYIGSWLAAWIRREDETRPAPGPSREDVAKPAAGASGRADEPRTGTSHEASGVEAVSERLAAAAGGDDPERGRGALQPDAAPIWHLREYSNYLTPRRGLWSTDAWTLGVAYIRNFVLTLSVLLGVVVTLVLAGQVFASGFHQLAGADFASRTLFTWPYIPFVALISAASLLLGVELAPRRAASARHAFWAVSAVILTLLSAAAGALWLWSLPPHPAPYSVFAAPLGLLAGMIGLGFGGRRIGNRVGSEKPRTGGRPPPREALGLGRLSPWVVIGSILAVFALLGLWWRAATWMNAHAGDLSLWHLVVWGVPFVVLTYSIAAAVSVGVSGDAMRELEREWLARFFAALAKWTALYTLLMLLIVYSHHLVEDLPVFISKELDADVPKAAVQSGLSGLWAVLSAIGAFLARRAPAANGGWAGWVRRALLAIAPAVFILGLLVITIWATGLAVHRVAEALVPDDGPASALPGYLPFFAGLQEKGGVPEAADLLASDGYWSFAFLLGVLVLLLTVGWSRRVGVNDFSLHALYGNRLVRAYLGASNLERQAHPFTGFDQRDNSVRMADLAPSPDRHRGPYLIINAAINLVSSRRLAWQKRKAASFTFTPMYCGYEFCEENGGNDNGNTRTGGYTWTESYGGARGVSLGKAMTISGAAASPNMGYHSSPALTFLMTAFNVRLGWWLPNPARSRRERPARQGSPGATGWRTVHKWWTERKRCAEYKRLAARGPRMGLLYLITEAMGMTGADKRYVYLSDGGHFENLGLYELVRRRCHLVIACDAEADSELTFFGLGNAIEKCRTDLGVPIQIDVSQIRRNAASGRSHWHCAVGCIRYSEADPGQHDGTLLYIKATLTGDEPQDVTTYAKTHHSFPHETTADQWFDETQFESYRALGEHSVLKVLRNAVTVARYRGAEREHPMERIFLELRKQWYPRSAETGARPADHDRQLETLLETLRTDSRLEFMDSQLYPNLQRVADLYGAADGPAGGGPPPETWRFPKDASELRAGFYFCKELIQLMQQVFHDRHLDTEYAAPSNRGWMNLFRRWALSPMFRFTWAMTAGTYSARLQSFCEYHLSLDSGEPTYGRPIHLIAAVGGSAEHPEVGIRSAQGRATRDQPAARWGAQAEAAGLYLYERWLINEFITAYVYSDRLAGTRRTFDFDVYPLKLIVDNVRGADADAETRLNAGLVIVGPDPEAPHDDKAALYFRTRPSMRNMDLARRAFIKMGEILPHSRKICLINKLPDLRYPGFESSLQRRAYREVHELDPENVERCRWFSHLTQDTDSGADEDQADAGEGGAARR